MMPMTRRAAAAGVSAFSLFLLTACHAEMKAKASADMNDGAKAEGSSSVNETTTSEPAAPAAAPAATPAPTAAPAAPPATACPLHCYVAWGADKADVTPEELAQIQSALEPALSRMRTCTEAQTWRRHGSPVLQLRVEPDGIVHEIDVDPHHGYDHGRQCIDDAARDTSISLPLPGRKAVRCNERCESEHHEKARKR